MDARDQRGMCAWRSSNGRRCEYPPSAVFESGLTYCSVHADAVRRVREWGADWFQWLEQQRRKTGEADDA